MKCTLHAALLAALLISACSDNNGNDPAPDTTHSDQVAADTSAEPGDTTYNFRDWFMKRYGVRKGIVELRTTLAEGNRTIRQVRYFDGFGEREAIHTFYDTTSVTPSHVGILADGFFTIYEANDTVASRTRWSPNLPIALPNFSRLSDEMRTMYNIREIDPGTYLGKECSGYHLTMGTSDASIWVWKGIPLHAVVTDNQNPAFGTTTLHAVSLNADADVPNERFQVPEGMKVEDLDMSEAF